MCHTVSDITDHLWRWRVCCCLVCVLSACLDLLSLMTGLTGNLLQKQPTDFDEAIEKLFSEVSGLEDFPKISDPQVDKSVWESLTIAHCPGHGCTVKSKLKKQQRQPIFMNEQTLRNLKFHSAFTLVMQDLPYVMPPSLFLLGSVCFPLFWKVSKYNSSVLF